MNDGVDKVVLQFEPETDEPVVSRFDTPPVPKPSASDMVRMNFCPAGSISWVENDPFWVVMSKEEVGIDTFWDGLNSCDNTQDIALACVYDSVYFRRRTGVTRR